MAQTTKFWDGVSYTDDDLAEYFADLIGSFVVPKKFTDQIVEGDELRITTSATNGKLTLKPGEAFVLGTYYQNDEDYEISLSAVVAANRIDYVVLRRDSTTQEVRPFVITGTPVAAGVIIPHPDTTADDMILAWVYIPPGFNPATTLMLDEHIHDLRTFVDNGATAQYEVVNHVPNPEFLAWSAGAGTAPDGWLLVGTPTIASSDQNNWKARGRELVITDNAVGNGIEVTIPISNDPSQDTLMTLSGYYYVDTRDTLVEVYYTVLGTGSTLLRDFEYYANSKLATKYAGQFIERFIIPAGADAVRVVFTTNNAGSNSRFYLGMLSLVKGYLPIVPVLQNEIIWLDTALADAAWTASAYSTAVNTVDLSANFGSVTLPYMRGVIATVRCRDSGSVVAFTSQARVSAVHPITGQILGWVSTEKLPNDTWRTGVLYFPIDHSSAVPNIVIGTSATGAGTLDVTIEIVGYIT